MFTVESCVWAECNPRQTRTMIHGTFEYRIAALSFVLSILHAYAVLEVASHIGTKKDSRNFPWLLSGAVFIGAVALITHFPDLIVSPGSLRAAGSALILALLISIVRSLIFLIIISRKELTLRGCAAWSLGLGGARCAMHYAMLGLTAGPVGYDWKLVAFSFLITSGLAFVMLRLGISVREDRFASPRKLISAAILGIAVSLTHTEEWAVSRSALTRDFTFHAPFPLPSSGIVPATVTILVLMLLLTAGAIVDRTRIKRDLDHLARRNESRFQTLVEAIPQIVWIADATGKTNYISNRWYDMTGSQRGTGLGLEWAESVHPDDRAPCAEKWQKSMRTGQNFEFQYRLYDAAIKEYRWFLDRAIPRRDDKGVIQEWFGTCTDIDDERRNQQELEDIIQKRTAALLESKQRLEEEMRERALAQQELNLQNERMVRELTKRTNRVTTLAKMAELLQSCVDLKDAFSVIAGMAPRVFPEFRGAVLLFNSGRVVLEVAALWNDCALPAPVFNPQECWAVRTGHMHLVKAGDHTAECRHVGTVPHSYVCIPLMSQGEAIGILHFQCIGTADMTESELVLTATFAEQVALSISNLRLREALRNQSIRDPLTGLFNRRYLEEMMERESRRAVRSSTGLGVLMIDLDHFKTFNDTYGHDAGDAVLRETAAFLAKSVRAEDIVCRFGGEEFVILLPMADLKATHARAERIRSKIREITIVHQGRSLGPVTVSVGVAALPEHGTAHQMLLQSADAALYRAKREGRDRVIVANPVTQTEAPQNAVVAGKS